MITALDLGRVDDDHEADETFAREVLDMLAESAADRADG